MKKFSELAQELDQAIKQMVEFCSDETVERVNEKIAEIKQWHLEKDLEVGALSVEVPTKRGPI